MKNNSKKFLSLLLVLTLTIGLFAVTPLTAGAETHTVRDAAGLETAFKNAASGDTIKLGANIKYAKLISVDGKTINIDLSGYKIDVEVTEGRALDVQNGGKVLIVNPANGEFNLKSSAKNTNTVLIRGTGSKAEMTNIYYTGSGNYVVVGVDTGSEAVIYGKIITASTSCESYGVYARGSKITVKGDIDVQWNGYGAGASNGGEVTIDGIITTTSVSSYLMFDYESTRRKTEFMVPTTKTGYLTYTDNQSIIWVKATPADTANIKTHTVGTAAELEAAFKNANNGDTIKLSSNIKYTKTISVKTIAVLLDLNGFTLDVEVTAGRALEVTKGGGIVLADPKNGKFNVSGSDMDVVYTNGHGSRAEVTNAAYNGSGDSIVVTTFERGLITVYGNVTVTNSESKTYGVWAKNGKIIVEGNIIIAGSGFGAATDVGWTSATGGKVHVKGDIICSGNGWGATADYNGEVIIDGVVKVADSEKYTDLELTLPTIKPGYITYEKNNAYGHSVIWIKEQPENNNNNAASESESLKPPVSASPSMSNFTVSQYSTGQFTDVDENQWYGNNQQKVVATAYMYGLMQGGGRTFNPTGNITLAEAVTIAARVHSIYNGSGGRFTQGGSPWYQVYVDYVVSNNIIAAGSFPDYNRAANRAEMAYIFSRSVPAVELEDRNTVESLPDVDVLTPYYEAIITMYKAGIVSGSDEKGTFNPDSRITRAEAAAIISRVILPQNRISGRFYG